MNLDNSGDVCQDLVAFLFHHGSASELPKATRSIERNTNDTVAQADNDSSGTG